jgi:hypothetical protein
MSAGQGFARRVTLENLARFAPLLKRSGEKVGANGSGDEDEDRANTAKESSPDPALKHAEEAFDGESVKVQLPFQRGRSTRPRGGTPGQRQQSAGIGQGQRGQQGGDQEHESRGADTWVTLWDFARKALGAGAHSEPQIRERASRILNFLCPGPSSPATRRPGYPDARIRQKHSDEIQNEFKQKEKVRYQWSKNDKSVDFNTQRLMVQPDNLSRYLKHWRFDTKKTYNPHRNERDEWVKMWQIV